jgi:23S rRNA pseudouridine2605 synthase
VVLHEGRNRQIRRMFATQGLRVARLVRTRVGAVRLMGLAPGEVRPLSASELSALRVHEGSAGSD